MRPADPDRHRPDRTRRTALAALALVVTASLCFAEEPAKAEEDALPPGVERFGGHHYLLVDNVEDLSWDRARKQCQDWGAHLVVVTTADEAAFIAKMCDGRYMYLGASDAAEEGTWVWVDGTPWSYTNWYKGQPNDYGGAENYLATYDDGQWVDVDGSGDDFWMPTGYICEWER